MSSSIILAMQEFSSVTASSYDADSLTPLLNEKAADGWSVVSIVAAGTSIVAYLQRESDGSADTSVASDDTSSSTTDDTSSPTSDDTSSPLIDESSAPTPDESTSVFAVETASEPELDAETAVDEPAVEDAPFVPVAAAPQTPDPVDEPAGWANAPDATSNEPADDSIAALAAQVSEPEAVAPVVEAAPSIPAATEPAPAAAPAAAEPAVPAGWYADPSGRFELRYWDGAAWTEHVSRAGQQFTDPPVA